jgi:two-component system sensor kinase FixL
MGFGGLFEGCDGTDRCVLVSWIAILWPMIASACLTLAAIHVLVWYRDRTAWANLLFSVTAAASAAFTFFELWMMRAETPAEFATAMRWAHVPLFFWIASLVWFVQLYLGAGRPWLAWTICGLRAFSLLPNFLVGQSLNYREITGLRRISFLGGPVTVAEGIPNPWMLAGNLAVVILIVFVADAMAGAWRRGDRRKAVLIGGSIEFFVMAGFADAMIVLWGGVQAPIVFSVPYLGLALVMGHELSRDVLRAAQLARELAASQAGLRESEQRMSLAVDAADLGIWVRDLSRNEIWASDRARELFGFAPSERLDLDGILKRLHPDDREGLRQAHAAAVAPAHGGRYDIEYRLILPDGRMRWIASQGRVERDAGGRPVLMRGASREITVRKRAEQELLRLRHELAHAGRVSMLGQLASGLAHEINQPLGAILRNAEAAELFLQHPSPDLDEVRAILADIRADNQRAGAVIDGMRGLLKRRTLDRQRLDVDELVGDVVALLRTDAAARQVKLDVELPGGLPAVSGDRVHIQQVLLNLMLNGMDAISEASSADRRVSVTTRLDGADSVEIAVGDSGHGIPADTLAHVFDPFFTTKPYGMGMGLSISRTIIEAHGGRLWAENNADGGAAFRFTLPVAEGIAAA